MSRPMPPFPWICLGVGVAALALSLLRLWWAPAAFFRSYLPACLFWIGLPLGSLALLLVHGLTGGGWGAFLRPVLAASAGALPVNVLLFIPLAFGLGALYPWAAPGWHPESAGAGQAIWLRPGFFLGREAVVLAAWLGLAAAPGLFSSRWTTAPAPRNSGSNPQRAAAGSALGLIVYGLTVTAFAIDWTMSLEPRWTSTNVGFLAAMEPLLAALAFCTLVSCLPAANRRRPRGTPAPLLGDLGGLLLAFLLLWGYLAFQQFLTVWSENLPDKAIWYVQRQAGGWRAWSWVLAVLGGALPFFLLLSRRLKRDPRWLAVAAGLVLAGHVLDVYWQVMPAFHRAPGGLSPLDAAPFLGIGGIWLAAFCFRLIALADTERPPHDR